MFYLEKLSISANYAIKKIEIETITFNIQGSIGLRAPK